MILLEALLSDNDPNQTLDWVTAEIVALPGCADLDVAQLWVTFCFGRELPTIDAFVGWLRVQELLTANQFQGLQRRIGIVHATTSDWSTAQIPTVGRRYGELGKLGEGAMGEVHLARDARLGRIVAVKSMKGRFAKNKALLGRFLLEAQVSAQLDHPNIVPVYSLERTADGAVAFAMKMIQGVDLEVYLTECCEMSAEGTLDEEHALPARLELFLKVCEGIGYAHSRGVIHRDLKPENVMIGAHGEVYVMDWGIARLMDGEEIEIDALRTLEFGNSGPGQTQVGTTIGTPAFMSPEQAMGHNTALTAASDQYTLGLLLFQLVTLRRANGGTTAAMAALQAQEGLKEEFVHLHPANWVSPVLGAIVARSTARGIDNRFPSVEALADDVRRYLRREETVAYPDNGFRKISRLFARYPARAATFAMTCVLLLVMAVGGAVVGGLVAVVRTQSVAADQQRRTGEMVGLVNRRAHAMDVDLFEHQSLAEQLGVSAARLLERAPQDGAVFYTLDQLKGGVSPADYAKSDRYEQAVSFAYPVNVGAPDAPLSALQDDMARLAPLREDFRRVYSGAWGEPAPGLSPLALRKLVADKDVPAPWISVGLESGLIVNYPGNPVYSPEFDTRKRPWYTMVKGTRGAQWGPPIPDDSGLGSLVPCSVGIYDAKGVFVGVVNLANGLSYLVHLLDIDELVPQTGGFLVEPEGRVVVQTGDEVDKRVDAGLYGNRSDVMPLFPIKGVRDAIAKGVPSGVVHAEDTQYVFTRLESLGWYYVVRVDGVVFSRWEPNSSGP